MLKNLFSNNQDLNRVAKALDLIYGYLDNLKGNPFINPAEGRIKIQTAAYISAKVFSVVLERNNYMPGTPIFTKTKGYSKFGNVYGSAMDLLTELCEEYNVKDAVMEILDKGTLYHALDLQHRAEMYQLFKL